MDGLIWILDLGMGIGESSPCTPIPPTRIYISLMRASRGYKTLANELIYCVLFGFLAFGLCFVCEWLACFLECDCMVMDMMLHHGHGFTLLC